MIDIHLPHAGLEWIYRHMATVFVVTVAVRIAVPFYFRGLMKSRSMKKFSVDPLTEYMVTRKQPQAVNSFVERRKKA